MTFYAISPTREENICTQSLTQSRYIKYLFLVPVLMELSSKEEKKQQQFKYLSIGISQKREFILRTKV